MSSGKGPLNGSGNQEVYCDVHYVSSDPANNRTRWYLEVRYYGNGWGSYSGTNWSWGCTGFVSTSGTFSIDYAHRLDTYTVLYSGYFYKTHNSSGVLAAGNTTASINTDHTSVGDGSVTVGSGTPPVLQTIPSVPVIADWDDVTHTSARILGNSASNGGATITGYEVQAATNSGFTTGVITKQVGTDPPAYFFTGLTEGTQYWWRMRATNARGTTAWSSGVTFGSTLDAIFVSNGSAWVQTLPKISNGSTWSVVDVPSVSTGSAWVEP